MPEWLASGNRLRLFSFILAFLAWFYVRFISSFVNPHTAETHLTVPILVHGTVAGQSAHIDPQDATLILVGELPSDAHVRVSAEVNGRGPGVYHVPLTVDAGMTILSLTPANVLMTIDKETP